MFSGWAEELTVFVLIHDRDHAFFGCYGDLIEAVFNCTFRDAQFARIMFSIATRNNQYSFPAKRLDIWVTEADFVCQMVAACELGWEAFSAVGVQYV